MRLWLDKAKKMCYNNTLSIYKGSGNPNELTYWSIYTISDYLYKG